VPATESKPEKPKSYTIEQTRLTEILIEMKKLSAGISKLAKSKNRNSGLSELQWFSTAQAAEWCGACSEERFRKLAKQYNIPRHGARKLFDRFELNEWILNPRCFLNNDSPSLRRGRRSASMEAIENIVWGAVRDSLRSLHERFEEEEGTHGS
jgi:hypothetical protein